MGQQIELLAQYVASASWDDVPAAARHRTKLMLLDTIGVVLAGSRCQDVQAFRERVASTGGTGATVLAPGWIRTDPRMAAMLNAVAGRAIEMSEGLRGLQSGIHIVPAVLAVGEWRKSTGRQMLEAIVFGYEVAGRLNKGFKPRALSHPNGQISLLAAVAATARLYGFDGRGLSLALRIATTALMTPSYTSTAAGATTLNLPAGMSGVVAALAPELVLAGFCAQDDAIEEALGEMVGDKFEATGLTDGLGDSWQILEGYFRFYACCNPIYPALDSLQDVLAVLKPKPADIARIDAETFAFATNMCRQDPINYFASKYSFPHAAATLIVRGGLNFSKIDESALNDPAISALRHKIYMTEDPSMTALGPTLKPARVTVTLTDGRRATADCTNCKRDSKPTDPEPEIREKFRELAGTTLPPEGVHEIERAVDRCEDWASADELFALLRRHAPG
jgi:2-methylcitrate dehydratase PrpD